MYQYGQGAPPKKHIGLQLCATLLVLAALFATAAWYMLHNTETVVTSAPPVERTVGVTSGVRRQFDETAFRFSVPKDWVMAAANQGVYELRPADQTDHRSLKIFVDNGLPDVYPASRFLPVRPEGTGVAVGPLSPVCTDGPKPQRKVVWQGSGFTCDLRTPAQGVAVSNLVQVAGPVEGKHTFLAAYSDNRVQPTFEVLTDMMRSLQGK